MECPACKKIFSRKDGLKRHPCCNDKIHECSICKKHFKRKDGLKRHVDNVHKGTRKRQSDDVNYQVKKQRIKEPSSPVSDDIGQISPRIKESSSPVSDGFGQISTTITDDVSHSDTQNTLSKPVSTLEEAYCYPEASLKDRIATYRINCSDDHDIPTFLEDVKMKSCNLIRNTVVDYAIGVKIQFLLLACYKKPETESEISEHTFSTRQELVTKHSDLENAFDHLADIIKQRSEKFQKCSLGLIFHSASHLDINIKSYKPPFSTTADYSNHSPSPNTSSNSVNTSKEGIPCVETSFKNRIATYFISCTENYDIPTFLEDVKMKSCTLIRNTVANYTTGLKMQFLLLARYKKLEAESEISELAINTRQEAVTKYSDLENAFDQLANVIKDKNVEFQERSSKLTFHSTSHLEININCCAPSVSTTTDYPSQSYPPTTSSNAVNTVQDGTPCVVTDFKDRIASYRIDCSENYDIPTFLKDVKVKSCTFIRNTIANYAGVKMQFLLLARYKNPEAESEITEHRIDTPQKVVTNYSDLENTFDHLADVIKDKSEKFQEHGSKLRFHSTCHLEININSYEPTSPATTDCPSRLHTQNNSSNYISPLKEDFHCVQSSFDNRLATYRINCSEKYDIPTFLKDVKAKSCDLIKSTVGNYRTCLKIQFFLLACYKRSEGESKITDRISFNTRQTIVTKYSDLENTFDELAEVIKDTSEEYQGSGSNFTFHNTSHFDIDINCFRPVKGSFPDIGKGPDDDVDCQARMEEQRIEKPILSTSASVREASSKITDYPSHSSKYNTSSNFVSSSYIELPKCIENKKACINIQNNDNACLAWCLVAALHPRTNNNGRITAYPHYSDKIKLGKIEFPVKFKDIPKIEEMNNLSINLFALEKIGDKYEVIGPVYFTQNKKELHVNLLILEKGSKLHYVLIKNLSRLVSSQISGINRKAYLCDGCLQRFRTKDQLDNHCKNICNHVHTVLPSAFPTLNVNGYMIRENILEFKNYNRKIKVPFVIYADFVSLLQPARNMTRTEVQVPYSFAYQIVCSFDRKFNKFETYTGLDCASKFISLLTAEVESLYKEHMKHKKKIKLQGTDRESFDSTRECYICGLPFLDDDKKIGAAHAGCNINFQTPKFIPVFLHNFSDYDVDLFVKELGTENDSIKIIALDKKKYISFSKNINVDQYVDKNGKKMNTYFELRFLDSLSFAPSSIEKLVKYLPEKKFKLLRAKYQPDSYLNLVKRKSIFPYDYMDDFERLNETELPPKEKFINPSTNEEISDEDFEHAQTVWNAFNCKSLHDYSNLYIEARVLLLTDIFECFREVCIKAYSLDSAHYYTAPGLSWDAMLKYTGIKLELFSDEQMLHFVKNNIRGELSQVSLRHAKANNKYMKDHDNSPSSYLMYWNTDDLNNWAMSQRLPYGDFRWLPEEEIEGFEVLEQSDEADTGYFLEVDVEYPKELHDEHNDLPFLVDKIVPPSSKFSNRKLMANLYDKRNYVLHYRNLKQALENGLKISKIHRILEFKQSNWLQPYINVNTERGQDAKNDFEKEFYKLMNDSVFRKTTENIDERVDVKLITHWEDLGRVIGARSIIAKPNFESVSKFGENLVGIHGRQLKVFYNKPDYISLSVSDLSKTLMYDFYYKKLKQQYQKRIKLCYTDPGSFIVHITTDDVYDDLKQNISEFDTSNYPQDNRFGIPLENKGILGLFKDENRGRIQTEFVGLRSKLYANEVEGGETSRRAEDMDNAVVKNEITFDDYRHCVLTKEQERLTISAQDDKRYVLENGIDTLAWGHYALAAAENSEK